MKKRFSIVITIVLLLLPASPIFAATRLANSRKTGLGFYTIDRILALKDSQIDIGTATLLLSKQWSNRKSVHIYRGTLDGMSHEILARLKKKNIRKVDARAIAVINKYLFEDMGYTSVETADNPNDLFLHNVIDTKRGYCLSLSVLYLSIAERIGLPLYGVVVPGHFFVRYDDGKTRINIETTSMGRSAPDKHYIDKFKPPSHKDSLYMKNLTNRQTLGCFFNNLGNSYNAVGDIETAQIELERAVRVNPTLAEAHTNLGNIYLRNMWADDAIGHYLTALKYIDNDPKTHNNLANAYGQIGKFHQAVDEYRMALKLQPDFVDAYRNLANTYLRQGYYNNAIAELKSAIRIKDDDGDSYSLLGDVYRAMKDYRAAMRQYERALRILPNSAIVNTNLAYCYYNLKRLDDAGAYFGAAIELDPSSMGAYFGLAMTYNKLGWTEDEIEIYEQLLSIEPDIPAALQNLGNAYIVRELYGDATECYARAIQLDPGNSGLRYNLGVAYANQDYYQEAIEQYLAAVDIDPKNASAHNAAAIGYYMIKNFELARKHALIAGQLGFDVQKDLLDALGK